ncbi:integrase catalytic subunit [Caballeronia arvi]|uniref:Integrase catalytic subunit n=1 Tax=Caballeronia arvi TaxID=1777135 RepID=A0A158L3T1_9BURK|nr:integrase catalytic subunit [Caballeronia arvi]
MTRTGTITMSMRELDRLKVIEAVAESRLMTWRAAERLGLSRRQVERLVIRYRAEGAAGLVSQRRGVRSNHHLPQTVLDQALGLIHEHYADFGPTLACEKLRECHGLVLSKETVRLLMTDAGLWVPRKQRPPKATSRVPDEPVSVSSYKSTAAIITGLKTGDPRALCWSLSTTRRAG